MKPMWAPSPERAAQTGMGRFMARAGKKTYGELHDWSVREAEAFWGLLWDFAEVRGEKGARTLIDGSRMPGAKWFPDGKLNFAENLLRRRDDSDAMVFWGEDRIKRKLSHKSLYVLVSRLQQALVDAGVEPGDRVAGYLP
ncbi:MAG: acetyl-coenzyme A synthetase N-terminal domain-containing protein, partial [Betaproteobacteria bacterium]